MPPLHPSVDLLAPQVAGDVELVAAGDGGDERLPPQRPVGGAPFPFQLGQRDPVGGGQHRPAWIGPGTAPAAAPQQPGGDQRRDAEATERPQPQGAIGMLADPGYPPAEVPSAADAPGSKPVGDQRRDRPEQLVATLAVEHPRDTEPARALHHRLPDEEVGADRRQPPALDVADRRRQDRRAGLELDQLGSKAASRRRWPRSGGARRSPGGRGRRRTAPPPPPRDPPPGQRRRRPSRGHRSAAGRSGRARRRPARPRRRSAREGAPRSPPGNRKPFPGSAGSSSSRSSPSPPGSSPGGRVEPDESPRKGFARQGRHRGRSTISAPAHQGPASPAAAPAVRARVRRRGRRRLRCRRGGGHRAGRGRPRAQPAFPPQSSSRRS